MAKGQKSLTTSIDMGGGSRAAKKRRKQKFNKHGNANPSSSGPNKISSAGVHNLPAKNGAKVPTSESRPSKNLESDQKARKSVIGVCGKDARHESPGGTKRKRAVGDAMNPGPSHVSPSATSGSRVNGDKGSKRPSSTPGSQPTPIVIDASEVDDRSRLLLELDAKSVLSDPDVESGLKAKQLLQWIVAPLPVEEFYDTYW